MRQLLISIFLTTWACNSAIAQKKVEYTYEFPAQMGEDVKKDYIKLFEKGKILYQVNCAKCHNVKINGVEQMPEFTKEHLARYELRLQNPQHEESLSEMRVSAEELQQIMIFLSYYKKVETKTSKK